ncbi:MAG: DUF2946 family protein [Xanthobacteraceae bacterium]
MRSLQSTRGFATWLALFALALQMVVSFGHAHLGGISHTDPAHVASATAGHSTQSFVVQQSDKSDDDDAYCPICASVYLTANSFVPAPPVLPLPTASIAIEHLNRRALFFMAPRRLAFQPRAPPIA